MSAKDILSEIIQKTRGALNQDTQKILRDILIDNNETYETLVEEGFA